MSHLKLSNFIIFIVLSTKVFAQENSADSLLNAIEAQDTTQALLPDRIFITQKLLWGKKGLLRITGIAPLTPEKRQKEMKIRRAMLKLHQAGGFITLAGMIGQGFVGAKLYNNPTPELRNLHSNLGAFVNASYATTALLSFTAPPPLINRKGMSSINIHKALAFVHLSGMIVTNVLAGQLQQHPELRPYHRAAAYSTFAAFAAATIVIKF